MPLVTHISPKLASGPASRLLSPWKMEGVMEKDKQSLRGLLSLKHVVLAPIRHGPPHFSPALSSRNQSDGRLMLLNPSSSVPRVWGISLGKCEMGVCWVHAQSCPTLCNPMDCM